MGYLTEEKFEEFKQNEFIPLAKEVKNLREDMNFEFTQVRSEMKDGFRLVDQKLDRLFNILDKDANVTNRLEAEVASAHSRIDRVETHLGLGTV